MPETQTRQSGPHPKELTRDETPGTTRMEFRQMPSHGAALRKSSPRPGPPLLRSAMTASASASLWRRPSALIAVGSLLVSLTGGLVTLQREHEGEQDSRLQRLEQQGSVADEVRTGEYQTILVRLDDLRGALSELKESLHRENDGIVRRLETLERRSR